MNSRIVALALTACLAVGARAAEEAQKSSAREQLKARIAEDAKKVEPKKTAPSTPVGEPTPAPERPPTDPAPKKKTNAAAAKEAPTVLPKVEVKKGRITELDHQLAKQQQEIDREKKNTKSTELDVALNDAKFARPLAIFGGESTQFRKGVASERVELMEAEKDILEAMNHAKTKEEKAALQKQLDELRGMRRELEKAMR